MRNRKRNVLRKSKEARSRDGSADPRGFPEKRREKSYRENGNYRERERREMLLKTPCDALRVLFFCRFLFYLYDCYYYYLIGFNLNFGLLEVA